MGRGVLEQVGFKPNPCRHCTGGRDESGVECLHCDGTGAGPQRWMVESSAYEILAGGAKGGGKTYAGIHFLIKGNPDQPDDGGANQSYILHPQYRALVTRLNEIDLANWIQEAEPVFRKLGGKLVDGDFKFPSGARISTGHLKDYRSYMKYQGAPQLHRWLLEEACQLLDFDTYMSVRSCVRSKEPGLLRTQVLLTANPEGPGVHWVADRFVRVQAVDGTIIPPRTLIRAPTIIDDREVSTTRVFIPAGVRDNPHLLKDDSYLANLNELPETRRLALLEGDWGAAVGAYFSNFRSRRLGSEPPNALHVVPTPDLKPWWDRAIGLDWGYAHDCAVYWGCRNPNTQQFHVYREYSTTKTAAQAVGAQLAELTLPDLKKYPGGIIPMFISHEIFGKTSHSSEGIGSIAREIMRGIEKVVGPDNISSPALELIAANDKARGHPTDDDDSYGNAYDDGSRLTTVQVREEMAEAKRIIRDRQRQGIVMLRAPNDLKLGWTAVHSALRWEAPYEVKKTAEFDKERYRLLAQNEGLEMAREYLEQFNDDPRRYPVLQIDPSCPKIIKAMQRAQADRKEKELVERKHFAGKDQLDALRYLVVGSGESSAQVPLQELRSKILTSYIHNHPELLVDGNDATGFTMFESFVDADLSDENEDLDRGIVVRSRWRRGKQSELPGGYKPSQIPRYTV